MAFSNLRCFALVVTIREVLRRGQHKFGFKESMRPNQTAKRYQGPVNPIALLLSNRQLRLRVSKHAELYTRPFIPPQDDLWKCDACLPGCPLLRRCAWVLQRGHDLAGNCETLATSRQRFTRRTPQWTTNQNAR